MSSSSFIKKSFQIADKFNKSIVFLSLAAQSRLLLILLQFLIDFIFFPFKLLKLNNFARHLSKMRRELFAAAAAAQLASFFYFIFVVVVSKAAISHEKVEVANDKAIQLWLSQME